MNLLLRSRALPLLLTLLAASATLQAAAQEQAVSRPGRAAEVRYFSRQKFRLLEARDTVAILRMLHPSLRYIHSNGWVETRADVTRHLADSTLLYHGVAVEADTVVLVGRHTAVITGRGVFDVSLRRAAADGGGWVRGQYALLYTEVWSRTGRRWVLVQRHACKAP